MGKLHADPDYKFQSLRSSALKGNSNAEGAEIRRERREKRSENILMTFLYAA